MPEKETSPEVAEPTSPEVQPEGQGQGESPETGEESRPTAEEIAKWKQDSADYAEANKKITEQGQQLATVNERNAQYERWYQGQQEKERQAAVAADPLAELRTREASAILQGDDAAFNAAAKQREDAIRQQALQDFRAEAAQRDQNLLNMIELRNEAKSYGVNETQLAQAARDLGVANLNSNNIASIAKYAAISHGTYDDSQLQAKQAAERESQLASLLGSGAQGGAKGPGMATMTPEQPKEEYNPFQMIDYLDASGTRVREGKEEEARKYLQTVDPEDIPEQFRNI